MPILLPYNALGNPNQKLVRSLLLLAVIASRVTRRSSMPRAMAGGSRSCEASVGSVRVRGPCHNGPWDAKYDPDVYTHIQDLSRQWTLLPGGWFHGLTRSPVALAYGPPLPRLARGPWFVSNVAVGRLTMAQWDPLGSIFPEAWAGGRVQVHHQDGQGRGALRVGMGIDRHGAARCVRQPLFFLLLLPRVAAKGQGGQHAVGVMRRVLMASSSSPLFLLLLCHDDELRVQAQMRAPPLDRMLPVVP